MLLADLPISISSSSEYWSFFTATTKLTRCCCPCDLDEAGLKIRRETKDQLQKRDDTLHKYYGWDLENDWADIFLEWPWWSSEPRGASWKLDEFTSSDAWIGSVLMNWFFHGCWRKIRIGQGYKGHLAYFANCITHVSSLIAGVRRY